MSQNPRGSGTQNLGKGLVIQQVHSSMLSANGDDAQSYTRPVFNGQIRTSKSMNRVGVNRANDYHGRKFLLAGENGVTKSQQLNTYSRR